MAHNEDRIWKALNTNSFNEMLDVYDVIASYIREKGGRKEAQNLRATHFLRRIRVNYVEGITEEDPHKDYASAVLVIDAPFEELDEEATIIRTKEIKKDWFPVIGSHNARTAKELLRIFLKGASADAVQKFLDKVNKRKQERETTNQSS